MAEVKVHVSIKNGKSKLFRLEEESTLKDLRQKINDRLSDTVGSHFSFVEEEAEIDQEDEEAYKLSEFKDGDVIKVTVVSEKINKTNSTPTMEEVKSKKTAAETSLNSEKNKLAEKKLNPGEKTEIKTDPIDGKLIDDGTGGETDDQGFYHQVSLDKLKQVVQSFKLPHTFKMTSKGLETVLYPGIRLTQEVSGDEFQNEAKLVNHSDAYYTELEKEVYKACSTNVGFSLGIPIPKLSTTLGISSQNTSSSESLQQSQKKQLFLIASRLVQKAKVVLNKQNIQVTDEFKSKIEAAVNSQDIIQLRKVFEYHGYLVPTAYIIGGKILAEKTETCESDANKSHKAHEFGLAVEADLDLKGFNASGSSSGKIGSETQDTERKTTIERRFHLTLQGGEQGLANDGAAWIRSLTFDKWQIVGYEGLQPITNFLGDELKKQCESMLANSTLISFHNSRLAHSSITNDAWEDKNYFGPLNDKMYADINPVFIPKGKKLVGLSFRQKLNRIAPRIWVEELEGNNPSEQIDAGDENDAHYFGYMKDIYVDTNPVFIPPGKILLELAFRQLENRLALKILVANLDDSGKKWIENNDLGRNYFGPCKDFYADTNPVFVPEGKHLVGFALQQKGGNRIAPVLLVQ